MIHPAVAARLPELPAICRRLGVRQLDLFGSAVSGRFRPGVSDLDFVVEFQDVSPPVYADRYFLLLEGLEEVFGCPVQLVPARTIKNPYFAEAVAATKQTLYVAK